MTETVQGMRVDLPEYEPLKLSPTGIKLIQYYEGVKLQAYRDSAGIYTIGYGNTFYEDGTKVKMGDKISKQRANELFALIVPKFEEFVRNRITRTLQQNEFDALVSFAYNTGGGYMNKGKWRPYNIWAKVNKNEDVLKYWKTLAITSGGKVLNGLIKRRKSEAELYSNSMLNLY
jgi:lysozyme